MGYDDHGWGAAQWLLMGGTMLLFWVAVIGLVVWALRRDRGGSPPPAVGADRLEALLAERYARGDIDEEEYLRRRAVLRDAITTAGGRAG